jgi:hypothetical protein
MKPVQNLSDEEFEHVVRRSVALPEAPERWIARAIEALPAAGGSALGALAGSAWRCVAAMLSFDSWAPAGPALAVRALPSDTRHLLFTAEGRDIDLRIAPTAQDFALAGQVLGPDETGLVELATATGSASGPAGVRTATLDELGEFRIEGVGCGTYRMTLRVGGDAIALPPIVVGEPRR